MTKHHALIKILLLICYEQQVVSKNKKTNTLFGINTLKNNID